MLFQQHQNRTKDSCYAQKTSFFSFRMACEADVVEETEEVETTFSMETLFLSRLNNFLATAAAAADNIPSVLYCQ